MKKQHVSESPHWNYFYWAVMAVVAWVILSSLFGCDLQSAVEIEIIAEPGDQTPMQRRINWMLGYWFCGCIAVAILAFYKFSTYPKSK